MGFQSTRPVWGATSSYNGTNSVSEFQSTRPVWGATAASEFPPSIVVFQSTRPVWGATFCVKQQYGVYLISIHAPRVGRDPCTLLQSFGP